MFNSLLAELQLSVDEVVPVVTLALVAGVGLFLLRWGSRKVIQSLRAGDEQAHRNWKKKYDGKFNQ